MKHEQLKTKFQDFLDERPGLDLDAHNCTEFIFEQEDADWNRLIEAIEIDDVKIRMDGNEIEILFFNPFGRYSSSHYAPADGWSELYTFEVA